MTETTERTGLNVVRGVYEAVGRGDLDAVVAALDEDVVWIEPEGGPYGGRYRGPEAVVEEVLGSVAGEWEEFAVEPERFVVDDGTVVALVTHRGLHENGERFEAPIADVWEVEDGRVVRFQHYVGDLEYVEARRE
jgi:hypothetical protein